MSPHEGSSLQKVCILRTNWRRYHPSTRPIVPVSGVNLTTTATLRRFLRRKDRAEPPCTVRSALHPCFLGSQTPSKIGLAAGSHATSMQSASLHWFFWNQCQYQQCIGKLLLSACWCLHDNVVWSRDMSFMLELRAGVLEGRLDGNDSLWS